MKLPGDLHLGLPDPPVYAPFTAPALSAQLGAPGSVELFAGDFVTLAGAYSNFTVSKSLDGPYGASVVFDCDDGPYPISVPVFVRATTPAILTVIAQLDVADNNPWCA